MTYTQLWQRITPLYDPEEAKAIVRMALEVHFGMSATEIYCGKVNDLSAEDRASLEKIMQRLEKSEPVQYIIGTAEFGERTFHVRPGVLIPRPETAELCQWIEDGIQSEGLSKATQRKTGCTPRHVLDIGTGSGCIAITLALDIPSAQVTGWDISEDALQVASENAADHHAHVCFVKQDALAAPSDHDQWDIIVSNPPYICEREKQAMAQNVLAYEPGIALFVPDEDPLKYYRAISKYAKIALAKKGLLYFEINPLQAEPLQEMLQGDGFTDIILQEDLFGKKRFLKCHYPKT